MRGMVVGALVLCLAAPAAAEDGFVHSAWLHLALAASMTAEGADLATTAYAFGAASRDPRARFREANPILRPVAHDPVALAIAKMGTAAAGAVLLVHLHRRHPRWALVIAGANTAVKFWVAARNSRLREAP